MTQRVECLAKQKVNKVPKLGKVFYESWESLTELGLNSGLFSDVRGIDFIWIQGTGCVGLKF